MRSIIMRKLTYFLYRDSLEVWICGVVHDVGRWTKLCCIYTH